MTTTEDQPIKLIEFAAQSLLAEIAESRFVDPSLAARAVADWSNVIGLPTGELGKRATLHIKIKALIDELAKSADQTEGEA